MNQNFYNSNSSGFDQTQPPQFPVIHPPPQETSIEILHDQENIINAVQTFLRKFNRYSFIETPKVLLLAWDRVFEIKDAFGNKQYKPEDMQELFRKILDDLQNIHKELAEYINTPGWNRPAFYDDEDNDDVDYTIAIIPEEPDNSLSMRDEHLDTIPATESDEVIKSSVEDLVPIPSESEGIPDTMCDVHLVNNPTPLEAKDHFEFVINSNNNYSSSNDDYLYNENIEYVEASPHDSELVSLEVAEIVIPKDEEIEDDNLREKLLNVNLLIAKIEALKDNPTPSSEFLTKSPSTSPKSFLEETNTFDNFLPKFENFCFDLEEISSGSTTTHYDISLSEYDSFIFDLSNDQFPPTDTSDSTHEEFANELAHIVSPTEYDCFYFGNLPDLGEWISSLNSGIRENLSSTTRVNLPVEDDHSPLLVYVVWIFLAYLMYPVIPPYLHSFGNEDTIFDPGIVINRFYSFKPGETFKKFNTHRSHLNESPMEMLFSSCFPLINSSMGGGISLFCYSNAYNFNVGGKNGWTIPPSESYNQWADRLRFNVNDTLHFKYNGGSDSVMVVGDYDNCNTNNPITTLTGGDSYYNLNRSGPFYFISGNKSNCDQGQKLIVLVISPRKIATPPAGFSSVPAMSPASSPESGIVMPGSPVGSAGEGVASSPTMNPADANAPAATAGTSPAARLPVSVM
nr:early nodulin-like protein 2 [Tanacetum cinerariifolium]